MSLRFDGAQFVSFKKMSIGIISLFNFTYADAVEIAGGAQFDSLSGNIIYTYPQTIESFGSNIYDDMNTVESHNTIYNNHIMGGLNALSLEGYSGGLEKGNIIDHNKVDTMYANGIVCTYQDSLVVRNNIVNIGLVNYGLYLSNCGGKDTSMVYNNFITLSGVAGIGLYSKDNSLMNVYYNSVANNSNNLGFACGYFTGTSSNKTRVFNNIFYNGINGAAIYGDSYGMSSCDYNDIYSAGTTTNCNWNGTWYSLSKWQSLSKLDAHSLAGDPAFYDISSGDLHQTAASIYTRHKGLHLASIKVDIDNQLRKLSNPDIGADEMPQDSDDVGVEAISNPLNNSCGSNNAMISIKIANYGIRTETNNFNVHVFVYGKNSDSFIYSFTGSLKGSPGLSPTNDTLINLTFPTAWNTSAGGKYTIKVFTDLATDGDNSNDTLVSKVQITSIPSAGFYFNKTQYCEGDTLMAINNSSGGSKYKYILQDSKGNSIDSSNNASPIFIIPKNGYYRIKQIVYNSLLCMDSISNGVHVDSLNADFTLILDSNMVKLSAINQTYKSYAWNFGDLSNDTGRKVVHVFRKLGLFHIVLSVNNGGNCTAYHEDSVLILLTGVQSILNNNFKLRVYPNPSSNQAFVSFNLKEDLLVVFELYDLNGHLLRYNKIGNLSAGSYAINLATIGLWPENQGHFILKLSMGTHIISQEIIILKSR